MHWEVIKIRITGKPINNLPNIRSNQCNIHILLQRHSSSRDKLEDLLDNLYLRRHHLVLEEEPVDIALEEGPVDSLVDNLRIGLGEEDLDRNFVGDIADHHRNID